MEDDKAVEDDQESPHEKKEREDGRERRREREGGRGEHSPLLRSLGWWGEGWVGGGKGGWGGEGKRLP